MPDHQTSSNAGRRRARLAALAACLAVALGAPAAALATPGIGASIDHGLCLNGGNRVLEHDGLLPVRVCFDDQTETLVVENEAPYWLTVSYSDAVVRGSGKFYPEATAEDAAVAVVLPYRVIPPGARYTYRLLDRTGENVMGFYANTQMAAIQTVTNSVSAFMPLPLKADEVLLAAQTIDLALGRTQAIDWSVDAGLAAIDPQKAATFEGWARTWTAEAVISLSREALRLLDVDAAMSRYTSGTLLIHSRRTALGAADRVIRQADGTSWYVDGQFVRHHIPDGGTYNCLVGWRGKVAMAVSDADAALFPTGATQGCSPTEAAGRIIRKADGTSYYVDTNLIRHWIPNGGTYNCLVGWKRKTVINNVTATQVGAFATGANQSCSPTEAAGRIIRKADGTSYYVDTNLIRHWIPNGGTYNCLVGWKRKTVINNVTATQVGAFATGANQSCSPTEAAGRIIRKADGTSYYVDTNLIRHWIPNGGTYNCLVYVRGKQVINNVSATQVAALAAGGNQTCPSLLVGPDGTSFYVDGGGLRHWVPDGGTFVCIQRRGVPVYRYSNWTTINRFTEDRQRWATC